MVAQMKNVITDSVMMPDAHIVFVLRNKFSFVLDEGSRDIELIRLYLDCHVEHLQNDMNLLMLMIFVGTPV